MDNRQHNTNQYGWYNIPKYQIERVLVTVQERDLDWGLPRSEYLYEEDATCYLQSSKICDIDDEDIVTPEDEIDEADAWWIVSRQRNRIKALIEDVYDENHYALARNSGFDDSFPKTNQLKKPDQPCFSIRTNKVKNVPKDTSQNEHQCNINVNINFKGTTSKNMLIVTLILIVHLFGGVLAYLMTGNLGTSPLWIIIYKKIGQTLF